MRKTGFSENGALKNQKMDNGVEITEKTDKPTERRKRELTELITKGERDDDARARRLIDEIVFLEERMETLKTVPFIAVDPKNPQRQRATAASKMYKEFLQQYNNSMRLLLRLSGDIGGEVEEESPLRAWARARKAAE